MLMATFRGKRLATTLSQWEGLLIRGSTFDRARFMNQSPKINETDSTK